MGLFRQHVQVNVIYKNGVKDRITPALLSTLINSKQVEQFERSSGWVKVASDPIRHSGATNFSGIERRKS